MDPEQSSLPHIEKIFRDFDLQDERRRKGFRAFFNSQSNTLHILLFILTFASTFFTAYLMHGNSVSGGLWFSSGIMSILLAHEMGHYLMCRKYRVAATLPYFIPFPILNPFGTFGAIIRMDGRIPSRKILFDIGAGGPYAGLIVTLPALYFGISWSTIVEIQTQSSGGFITLGESFLFKTISWLAIGELPAGYDIVLHPLGFAGWAGLFVTALNLLPVGQLDGGHVIYALMGRRSRYVYPVTLGMFILLSIWFFKGWALMAILLLVFGQEHPPTTDKETPLDRTRIGLALFVLLIFFLSFAPVPITVS